MFPDMEDNLRESQQRESAPGHGTGVHPALIGACAMIGGALLGVMVDRCFIRSSNPELPVWGERACAKAKKFGRPLAQSGHFSAVMNLTCLHLPEEECADMIHMYGIYEGLLSAAGDYRPKFEKEANDFGLQDMQLLRTEKDIGPHMKRYNAFLLKHYRKSKGNDSLTLADMFKQD